MSLLCVLLCGASVVAQTRQEGTYQQGKTDQQAIVEFRAAIERNPDNVEACLNFGLALAGQGNLLQAEYEIRKVLRVSLDYTGAPTALGRILARTTRVSEVSCIFGT